MRLKRCVTTWWQILGQVGIRLESRGEELGIDALIDLSNNISDCMLQKKQIVLIS